ncbi:hypothetical protein F2Q68_00002719 [Brassica cretica]|uniref:1,3-beta-glucan synthase component FKS1-like domain-containing protein n=1 Tax=Brassica cretica TaxID=69181 RepID=A0A8S9JJY8_BRACR|nr:hypothetical protein F2Q68_00002719 [Brassica cretica]
MLSQKLDDAAVNKVFLKSLDNYIKWCDYLCVLPGWSNLGTISGEKKLLFLSLYFLIWVEAANIRFLPECLCYIFHHMVGEVNEILRQRVARPAVIVMAVLAMVYHFLEAFNNENGRAPHSTRRNYDDFNEYLWEKHRGGKTSFVEHRTFLRLYHSFHRLWIFLAIMFQTSLQAIAIIAFYLHEDFA